MNACKSLVRTSLSAIECKAPSKIHGRSRTLLRSVSSNRQVRSFSSNLYPHLCFSASLSPLPGFRTSRYGAFCRRYNRRGGAVSLQVTEGTEENIPQNLAIESPDGSCEDRVEELLSRRDDISTLMKMERRSTLNSEDQLDNRDLWFPYLDKFRAANGFLSSGEVLEALDPLIMDDRKKRFRKVAKNRSYSVCLVVEGLSDFGNVSAAFRSADALGIQSVHVVACDSSKRYRENRHVSMGAEKWLDIEVWDSTLECFNILKSRGYRIATTHLGSNAVSIYDMDWTCPTAVVVGNESRGISNEALELSDLHCIIPMNGMVDSFNVSVAAGVLMHHAVCDRASRMGCHGDLTSLESQILLAEFSLRHSKTAISIANEYARRKALNSTH